MIFFFPHHRNLTIPSGQLDLADRRENVLCFLFVKSGLVFDYYFLFVFKPLLLLSTPAAYVQHKYSGKKSVRFWA